MPTLMQLLASKWNIEVQLRLLLNSDLIPKYHKKIVLSKLKQFKVTPNGKKCRSVSWVQILEGRNLLLVPVCISDYRRTYCELEKDSSNC